MIVKCTVEKIIKSNGKLFYLIVEIISKKSHVISKNRFKYMPLILNNIYDFNIETVDGKDILSIINLDYEIRKIYSFKINRYLSFFDDRNKLINIIFVEINPNIEVEVRGLEWHRENFWSFYDLFCVVIGFTTDGIPKLIVNDNRHPIYAINEVHSFEVLSISTKINSKNNEKFKVLKLTDRFDGHYEVPLMPNQEEQIKIRNKIDCKVINISTHLILKQEITNDPFFHDFKSIINSKVVEERYFTPYLNGNEKLHSIKLKNQYESKSAFWVFTYCNEILIKLYYSCIYFKDYLQAFEINNILLNVEQWILSYEIYNALENDSDKISTCNYVKRMISRLLIRKKILPFLIYSKEKTYLKIIKNIDSNELYELIYISDLSNIDENDFIEIIENIIDENNISKNRFTLEKLCAIIENKKKQFIQDIKEDSLASWNRLSTIQELNLTKYLLWSYSQYLIYQFSGEVIKRNLILGKYLRFWTHTFHSSHEKEILLYNAFFILSNKKIEHSVPIFRDGKALKIDFDKLNKNPNTSYRNKLQWDIVFEDPNSVYKLNIIEKYYKGYKVEISGITGFLPIQNIADPSLKINAFKDLNWELNAHIHLYSKDFNFFIAKQIKFGNPNYYSKKNTVPAKLNSIILVQLKAINDYGLFFITPHGDALLHKLNISKNSNHWDRKLMEETFKIGDFFYTKIINIEGAKIELGLIQLIGTSYESYYYNLIYENQHALFELDNHIEIPEDSIDREFEIEKGFVFEQFALIQSSIEKKISYIRLAKQFFSNTQNARSYLHNIYIDYFNSIVNLNNLINSYSLDKYAGFRSDINKIKSNINPQTLKVFPESESLIFFVNILSLFNSNSDLSNIELMDYIKKYTFDNSNPILKTLAKMTLANNLLLFEVNISDEQAGEKFSLKNLKRIRDYLQDGVFTLSETDEEKLQRELMEKTSYWRNKIKLDEGEKLEFKATFITPIPSQDKLRIVTNLEEKLKCEINEKARENIKKKIDEINGLDAQKIIIHSALKSIAAFSNTNGGELLLGVSNDKEIFGLEIDYDYFKKIDEKNRDGFGKFLDSMIKDYFGNSFSSLYLEKEFLKFPEGDILIIKVKPSAEEVFILKDEYGKQCEHLYIRNLSSSEKLEGMELAKFIRSKSAYKYPSKFTIDGG
jgi:hypothetical protein